MDFPRKNRKKERIETIETCSLMELEDVPVSLKPEENFEFLKQLFSDCSDFVIRKFKLKNSVHASAIFVDGLIDTKVVNQALMLRRKPKTPKLKMKPLIVGRETNTALSSLSWRG